MASARLSIPSWAWVAAEAAFLLFIFYQLWDFEVFLFVAPVGGKLIIALLLLLRGAEMAAKGGKPRASPELVRVLSFLEGTRLLLVLLAVAFLGYLLTKSIWFGYLVALAILLLVAEEIVRGVALSGVKAELGETRVAVYFALGLWFGAGFLLQTSSPINAIVSCSMLPNMERGDLVILQGGEINAPTVRMSSAEAASIGSGAIVRYRNESVAVNGSLYAHCVYSREDPLCGRFVASPEEFFEMHGPLVFRYGRCERHYPETGASNFGPCTSGVYYNGERASAGLVGDTVVYVPKETDVFARSGDIIHRVMLKIETPTGEHYVIKGDNNPVADVQIFDYRFGGNSLADQSQLKGKVLFRVPYLGYFKLFLSGFVEEGESCNSYLRS